LRKHLSNILYRIKGFLVIAIMRIYLYLQTIDCARYKIKLRVQ